MAAGALLGLAGPVHAQDDGGAEEGVEAGVDEGVDDTGEEGGADSGVEGAEPPPTEVRGTLRAPGEDGEDVFLEGVELAVSAADGTEVGVAVSDAEGNWRLDLPGAGEYATLLREETLPEGVTLRNPENNPLTFSVNEGDSRPNLFPMGGSGASLASANNTIRALQLAVDGAKLGLLIAMCAIGLSLIYGTTGLVNFAHGEMVTFGAMIGFLFHMRGVFGWETALVVAGVFATILGGVGGFLFNQGVWRPLRRRGSSLISMLVVSIGFSIFFRYVMLYVFGGRDGFYRDYRIQERIDFGWFELAPKDLWIMGISVTILVGVASALQYTRMGKAMRAVADNRDLAASSGIDVEKVIRWVWIAGSALAALGGVLFATSEAVGWEMGFRILLLMFAGVTLGGLGTAYGALFGSLVVGVFIQTSTLVIPSDMKNVGALLMLVLVLLVRPQGLFGRAERIG
jgi:branched-chain amino acid transport system permease protein